MNPITRRMHVVRQPGTYDRPMIRIANSALQQAGFKLGTPFAITYQSNLLTIKKLKHEHNDISKTAVPFAPSGPHDAPDEHGRAGTGQGRG